MAAVNDAVAKGNRQTRRVIPRQRELRLEATLLEADTMHTAVSAGEVDALVVDFGGEDGTAG